MIDEEAVRREARAQYEAEFAATKAAWKEKTIRELAQKRAAKASLERSATQQQARSESREPGEIFSQEDASQSSVPTQPRAMSLAQDPPSAASGPLASWNSKKERRDSTEMREVKAERKTDDEFLGFGHVPASQQEANPPRKQSIDFQILGAAARKINKGRNPTEESQKAKPTGTTAREDAPSPSRVIPAKRPSVTLSSANLTSLKIAKKTSIGSPQSPAAAEISDLRNDTNVINQRPPQWYKDTKAPHTRGKDANVANVDVALQNVRDRILFCKQRKDPADLQKLRDLLHKVIFLEVSGPLLKRHRLLDSDAGLPSVFDPEFNEKVKWPFDVKADAAELFSKWSRQIFETDILHGIKFGKKESTGKNEASIMPGYKVSAKFHGNGNLLNGQWWAFQICALRDGAHGASQGGIYGSEEDGVYSCIMAGGANDAGDKYPDEDYGNKVLYCGTDSTDGKPTLYTRAMMASVGGKPVRLIRSHKLGSRSKYAPTHGFRYDGLYDVKSFENLDGEHSPRQRHRFTLVRCKGQDPIRGGDGPERRPTEQEVEEYKKHQKHSGKVVGCD